MGKLDQGTMCIMCQTLPLSKPRTPGHLNMAPLTQKEDWGELGTQCLYRCSVCHTHWLCQQDKWQACLGFKFWTGNLDNFQATKRRVAVDAEQVPYRRISTPFKQLG